MKLKNRTMYPGSRERVKKVHMQLTTLLCLDHLEKSKPMDVPHQLCHAGNVPFR